MKERELRAIAKCAICDKPFGHSGLPLFYRVTIERYGVDLSAVKRQDGLGAMLGSAALAQVMGEDAEMATVIDSGCLTVCEPCSLGPEPVAELLELSRSEEAVKP